MSSSLSALYAHSRHVELARNAAQRCCGIVRGAANSVTARRSRRRPPAACCA